MGSLISDLIILADSTMHQRQRSRHILLADAMAEGQAEITRGQTVRSPPDGQAHTIQSPRDLRLVIVDVLAVST
jgi:hypothetical protein